MMNGQTVKLMDPSGNVLATACVTLEGEHYGGTVDLRDTPKEVVALFAEFEEIVSGQMFSFLDEIQNRFDALSLRVVFDDGWEAPVRDLQVFPTSGGISFKLAEMPAQSGTVTTHATPARS